MTQRIELEGDPDAEQYDEIPWSHLVEDLGRSGPSIPMIAGVVLVVGAALGFVGAMVFGGGDTAEAEATPPEATAEVAATAPPPTGAPLPTAATTTATEPNLAPSPEVLFSEADLMAIADDHEIRAAAVRAEWFVRDYFTVDDSSSTSDQVAAWLAGIPTIRDSGTVTYVEWARAIVVEPTAPGEYDVTVAFQPLATDGDVFVRHPARAVLVPVAVGPALETTAAGLPRPAPLDTLLVAPPAVTEQPAPRDVTDEAISVASRFGTDATVIRSWLDGGTWHIVTNVRYAGAVWPLQVDIQQTGSPP